MRVFGCEIDEERNERVKKSEEGVVVEVSKVGAEGLKMFVCWTVCSLSLVLARC